MTHMKNKNPFRKLNFITKLILIISVFNIGLVLLISYLNYYWHSKQVINQTIEQTQQIIEQLGDNIDQYMEELFRLTLAPYYDDTIMDQLASYPAQSAAKLAQKREIETFLASVMTLPRDEILRVYIMNQANIYSYTKTPYEMEDYNTYTEADWYKDALATTQPIYIPVHSEKAFGQKETQIFSIARQIRSKENNEITLAVIKVDANYTGIKSICDMINFSNDSALYVVTDTNDIVYQKNLLPEKNLLEKMDININNGDGIAIIDNEKYFFNVTTLEESNLKVIAVNSYLALTQAARQNLNSTIVLVSICIFISLILLLLFITEFFKPLNKIIEGMKKVETGDMSVQVDIKNQDEIGYIANAFNEMVQNLNAFIVENNNLIKEVYESQYLQKESQYNALCSQIKPHFLYNTLNTFSLLIKCHEYDKAITSIEDFSYYLRGVMNTDKEILLSAELKIVEAYLDIQKLRYEEKLHYEIKIDAIFSNLVVPALILQPIVENAVKHGCERQRGKTLIMIESMREEKDFIILIKDNGKGMGEENLIKINNLLNSEEEKSSTDNQLKESGIGLLNVHRRLKLKFGKNSGIQIISDKNGTTIKMVLSDVWREENHV